MTTLSKLPRSLLKIHVCDNSTISKYKESNKQYCEKNDLIYTDMQGNVGLSKAYNAAISKMEESEWLLLFDQDTTINEHYLRELQLSIAKYPDIFIHVPVVQANKSIISPAHIRGHRVHRLETVAAGIYSDITAINTGTAIKKEVFDLIGTYNEAFFLDYLDHDFIRKYKKKYKKIAVFICIIDQDFSDDDHHNRERDIQRFTIYKHDFYLFCKDNIFGIFYYSFKIIYRAVKLTRIYQCTDFIKIAIGR